MVRQRLKTIIGKQSSGFSRNVQLHRHIVSERGSIDSANRSARDITNKLMAALAAFEDVSDDIIIEALEPTLELAKYYAPKDTGELADSGYVESVSSRGKPRVEIGFAKGGHPYYAAFVHEATHIPHAEPTRSKFLQTAVFEDLTNIEARLANGYRQFMSGG